jgi:hypothetical protein
LIVDGVNGVLCADRNEWANKIKQFFVDPALRDGIGRTGLKLARDRYTVARSLDRLRQALAGSTATE